MSRKSRDKKFRKIREQAALQTSTQMGENTERSIGDLINRLVVQKQNNLGLPNVVPIKIMTPPNAQLPTLPTPVDWPECPSTCDLMEWRRSLENRDHYLLKQMDDNNAKPWFQYPRYDYQYSELVYITPPMAEELLKFNPVNRHLKEDWVETIRRDIVNHRWIQSHEAIAVNKLGNMHDGQHRASGIVKANLGWPFYVTFNVDPAAMYVCDSGRKRPVNEKLAYLFPELKSSHKTAAVCRSMMCGLNNRNAVYSETEIADFMLKYNDVISWVIQRMKYRADLQAVVGKAMLWWGEAVIEPFVTRLDTIMFTSEGDPAKALYSWLQDAKKKGRKTAYISPIIYYKKALAAIVAHAEGRDTKRIMAKEKDIFEWLPGWEVPTAAPCKGVVFQPKTEPPAQP